LQEVLRGRKSYILVIIIILIIIVNNYIHGYPPKTNIAIVLDPTIPESSLFANMLKNKLEGYGYTVQVSILSVSNLSYYARSSDIIIVIAHSTARGHLIIKNKIVSAKLIYFLSGYRASWILISCNNPGGITQKILRERGKLLYYSPPISSLNYNVLENIISACASFYASRGTLLAVI
jgi:galactitol-specific phosphotransferase system IIB component